MLCDRSTEAREVVYATLNGLAELSAHPALRRTTAETYRTAATPEQSAATGNVDGPQAQWQTDWQRTLTIDAPLLFRYSALTLNAHWIRYDRRYAQHTEGCPGLVVHAPLTATLLMDLFLRHRPGARATSFAFRARRSLFDGVAITLCGRAMATGADVLALDHLGRAAMLAQVLPSDRFLSG